MASIFAFSFPLHFCMHINISNIPETSLLRRQTSCSEIHLCFPCIESLHMRTHTHTHTHTHMLLVCVYVYLYYQSSLSLSLSLSLSSPVSYLLWWWAVRIVIPVSGKDTTLWFKLPFPPRQDVDLRVEAPFQWHRNMQMSQIHPCEWGWYVVCATSSLAYKDILGDFLLTLLSHQLNRIS